MMTQSVYCVQGGLSGLLQLVDIIKKTGMGSHIIGIVSIYSLFNRLDETMEACLFHVCRNSHYVLTATTRSQYQLDDSYIFASIPIQATRFRS